MGNTVQGLGNFPISPPPPPRYYILLIFSNLHQTSLEKILSFSVENCFRRFIFSLHRFRGMVFSEMDGYLLQKFVKFGVLRKLFCVFNHPIKDTSGVMATRVYEFLRIFEVVYYIIAEGKPERGLKK